MSIPGLIDDNKLASAMILRLVENFETHPIRTAAGFRNAVLEGLFAINPILDIQEEKAVNSIVGMTRGLVSEGKMIDFGFIPNAVLQQVSIASRDVFEAGELQHPYENWLGVSAWEGGYCGYLVSVPLDQEREVMVFEIYGVALPDLPPAVLVNDFCIFDFSKGNVTLQPIRTVDNRLTRPAELERRGANMLDPMVTFLRILSDASVPVIDVPAPERLNKRRVAKGHEPIPAHTRVETRDYVSLFQAHKTVRNEGTGLTHHASPIPHWRRAHQRHLASGTVVPVRSTKVNWRESEELHRLFTRVKP